MIAALNDLAVVDHWDIVGLADGAQAVGDDETGPLPHQAQHRLLDFLFRWGWDLGDSLSAIYAGMREQDCQLHH
jgi:hypothetical protein